MSRMPPANEHGEGLVFLDACCAINLFATNRAEEILRRLPYRFAVARYVAEREILEIDAEESETGAAERVGRLSLRPSIKALVEKKVLESFEVSSSEEIRQLVRFASDLDDGEAHTCALALVRGARVATDDKKAIRVIAEAWRTEGRYGVDTAPSVSTSELLFQWAAEVGAERSELATIVRNITRRASFIPPRNDPHVQSWLELLKAQ